MITPKSLNVGWLDLRCSVQGCPKKPKIGLQVDRRGGFGMKWETEEVIPPTNDKLPHTIAIFTPCPSDEGKVRQYLEGRGYSPDMVTVIPKETIGGYIREETEWRSRAGRERQ